MEKNPFSIYDFMGYLFPGILVMFILCYVFCGYFNPYDIFNLEAFVHAFKLDIGVSICMMGRIAIFVVISYILGHLISYISSLTIELVFRRTFGYPSTYLFKKSRITWKEMFKNYFETIQKANRGYMKVGVVILKAFLLVVVAPISIMNFTLGHVTSLNLFVTRSLDDNLISIVQQKYNVMQKKLNIDIMDSSNMDKHRLVMHYAYHNVKTSQNKTENYIALYGFLRCISFIFCLAFDALAIYGITTIDINAEVSWDLIIEIGILFFIAYVSYLGFTKFYRKYTLENYMALVVDPNLEKS